LAATYGPNRAEFTLEAKEAKNNQKINIEKAQRDFDEFKASSLSRALEIQRQREEELARKKREDEQQAAKVLEEEKTRQKLAQEQQTGKQLKEYQARHKAAEERWALGKCRDEQAYKKEEKQRRKKKLGLDNWEPVLVHEKLEKQGQEARRERDANVVKKEPEEQLQAGLPSPNSAANAKFNGEYEWDSDIELVSSTKV
jgi:hypothetical protein